MPIVLIQILTDVKMISRQWRLGQLNEKQITEKMAEVHTKLGKMLKEKPKPKAKEEIKEVKEEKKEK